MVRTQIQLSPEQHAQLQQWAQQRGISFSEAVRRCIAEKMSQNDVVATRADAIAAALAVCGRYADPSGETSVAKDHDRHLAVAFAAQAHTR